MNFDEESQAQAHHIFNQRQLDFLLQMIKDKKAGQTPQRPPKGLFPELEAYYSRKDNE